MYLLKDCFVPVSFLAALWASRLERIKEVNPQGNRIHDCGDKLFLVSHFTHPSTYSATYCTINYGHKHPKNYFQWPKMRPHITSEVNIIYTRFVIFWGIFSHLGSLLTFVSILLLILSEISLKTLKIISVQQIEHTKNKKISSVSQGNTLQCFIICIIFNILDLLLGRIIIIMNQRRSSKRLGYYIIKIPLFKKMRRQVAKILT